MKRKYSEAEKHKIIAEYQKDCSPNQICTQYNIGKTTLYRWLRSLIKMKRTIKKEYTAQDVYRMERELHTLREENQIFHESGCSVKATIDEKITAVELLKEKYTVHAICRTLELSKATYYNNLLRSPEKTMFEEIDEKLRPVVQMYFYNSKERFGASKIRIMLMRDGFTVSRKHISRLMKEMNLICKQARLRCFNTTNRQFKFRRNHLLQNFNQETPNCVWVSDISYARVNDEFYAICVIIDLFSRKVLSYTVSPNNNTDLALKCFQQAYALRKEPSGLTFHSDQGIQYAAYKFRKYLRNHQVIQSFSNPGTPLDNAVAESFFSMMKREELSHNYYHSQRELEKTVSDYIDFFNVMRPLDKLGALSPNQYEKKYFEALGKSEFAEEKSK